jgi:serine/threonine-protein kinase
MSPEQAKGSRQIDARSDLYSVGVILYETITGQVPFSAETFNELIFRIVLESPPPAESFVPNLDGDFAGIVRKAMAREPHERFQTAEEFELALAAWEASPKSQRAPGLALTMARTRMAPRRPPDSQDAPTIARAVTPSQQDAATVARVAPPGLQDAATIARPAPGGGEDAATIARPAPPEVDDQAETIVRSGDDPTLRMSRPSPSRITPPPLPVPGRRAPAGSVVVGAKRDEPDASERLVLSASDLEVVRPDGQQEADLQKELEDTTLRRVDMELSPAAAPTVPPPRPRSSGLGLWLVIATAAFLAGGAFAALQWVTQPEGDPVPTATETAAEIAPAAPSAEAATAPAAEAPPAPSETGEPAPPVTAAQPPPARTGAAAGPVAAQRPPSGAALTAKPTAAQTTAATARRADPAPPAPPASRKPGGRTVSSEL